MTATAADRASHPLGSASHPAATVPSSAGIPKINPITGLSTDYLNHFTEALMVLDMAAASSECLDDLQAWLPKTYREHVAGSSFGDRAAILSAYEAADPAVRQELDAVAKTLNVALTETRDRMLHRLGTPAAEAQARRAVAWLQPLITRAAALINGGAAVADSGQAPQAAIDAIFDR